MTIMAGVAPTSCPTNEQQLLLEVCRLNGASRQRVKAIIEKGIDWRRLRQRAEEEGVIAFLSSCLGDVGVDSFPSEAVTWVQQDYTRQSFASLAQTAQLIKLTREFETNGIDCIAFKGPSLACLAYGDLTARQYGDLDLLIRRTDLRKAMEVLAGSGFTANERLTEKQLSKHSKRRNAVTFSSTSSGCRVDLQWRLTPDYVGARFDTDSLFDHAESQQIEGYTVRRLADVDLIPYLAVHGACHVWNRILLVLDFASVAAKVHSSSWKGIWIETERHNVQRMLLTAVAITQELGYFTAPPTIRALLEKDQIAHRMAGEIVRKLKRGDGSLNFWEISRFLFMMQPSARRRIRYLAAGILVPSIGDWQTVSLPAGLGFVYWPIRIVRLARSLMMARIASQRKG